MARAISWCVKRVITDGAQMEKIKRGCSFVVTEDIQVKGQTFHVDSPITNNLRGEIHANVVRVNVTLSQKAIEYREK